MRLTCLALGLSAAFGLHATQAYRPGDHVCVVSPTNDCAIDKITPSERDGSTLIYPGGKTRCAYDNWSNPATSFSTNATYFFQVFPTNAKQKKTKLMLYLDGGGACLDDATCSFAFLCASGTDLFYANAMALSSGVLNRTDPTNIFNDWTIVHVPQCTGDVHMGKTTHSGTDQGFEAMLNKPECLNQNQTLHQNGFENTQSAFDWAFKNFPNVDQLALVGYSAGSLAVQIYSKTVADKWQVEAKKTKFSVLTDSFVGVAPKEKPIATMAKYWNTCTLPLGFSDDVVVKCNDGSATIVDLVAPMIMQLPNADWLYANSKGDTTQRTYYEFLRQGVFAYPFKEMLSTEDLYSNMTAIIESYKKESSKITTFFQRGERHVFFKENDWASIQSADGKTTLGKVVRDIIVDSNPPTPPPGPTTAPPNQPGCKDAMN